MKKIVKWFIYGTVLFLILLLSALIYNRIKAKITTEQNIQTLYEFCAFSIGDNRDFCTESIQNKSVLILFMNPECDFCHEEIKQIKEQYNILENVSILLISAVQKKQATDFYSDYQLSQYNNIKLLIDENGKMSNYYDVKTIPTIFVYDKSKKLIFTHKGEIKIEAFIQYFTQQ